MADGKDIFAFASAPVTGVIAGFLFKKHECASEFCPAVWNKDAALAVAAAGWFVGVGYEAIVLQNDEMVPWFLGALLVVTVALLVS